jgi:hypothetical protein
MAKKRVVCDPNNFDVVHELAILKKQTIGIRRPPYKTPKKGSTLDKYKSQLLRLHSHGATTAHLQRFLKKRRITVVHSTVARWLKKQNG